MVQLRIATKCDPAKTRLTYTFSGN
uniref:Uncharacterized protein n=1 Tax=Arundo donax TaxID=35708 RepID=A0A0A8ZXI5_ARUDO